MPKQLQKAINLAKKTGDRLIVYDMSRSDDAYVVMSLDEYEKMALGKNEVRDLTEDELLDKINRDIAVWKNEQYNKEETVDQNDFSVNDYIDHPSLEEESEEDNYDFNSSFYNKTETEAEEKISKKNPWAIPPKRKDGAEEIIEEDRQYLEEVNF